MQTIQFFDEKIVLFFQSIRFEALTDVFKVFIPFEFWYAAALILVLFFFFQARTLRVPVISFFLAWNGAMFWNAYFKDYFHRPRPFVTIKGAIALMTPHGFSLPSGHATLAGAMVVVLAYHFPKARNFVFALALLIGFSRIYFGVHYLTDVLAGFLLGALVGALSLIAERIILRINKGG